MQTDSTKLTDTAKLLKECDAGTKMAISSINEILEKVEDSKLNEILTHSRNAHEQLESEIHSLIMKKTKKNQIQLQRVCLLLKQILKWV